MARPETFRVWTELSRAILQNKQARLARSWYALRANDPVGDGFFRREDALKVLVTYLSIGEAAAEGLLREGEGAWWTRAETHFDAIRLVSQRTLAERFEVKLGYAVDLPVGVMKKLATFRAHLYMSWFVRDTWSQVDNKLRPVGGKTISIANQQELFGASKSTILGWQRRAGMRVENQYAFVKTIGEQTSLPDHVVEGAGVFTYDVDGDDQEEVVYRIPNRLAAPQAFSKEVGGMRVGEAARKSWQNKGLGGRDFPPAAKYVPMYYDDPRAETRIAANPRYAGNHVNIFDHVRPGGARMYRALEL